MKFSQGKISRKQWSSRFFVLRKGCHWEWNKILHPGRGYCWEVCWDETPSYSDIRNHHFDTYVLRVALKTLVCNMARNILAIIMGVTVLNVRIDAMKVPLKPRWQEWKTVLFCRICPGLQFHSSSNAESCSENTLSCHWKANEFNRKVR